MRNAFIAALTATLILSGCERSQVNYEEPSPTDRYVFGFTGNEMLMWTLAGAVVVVLGGRDLDPTDDELSW